MRADQAEVSWDQAKGQWLVRVQAGDEVIRRHSGLPREASEQQLRDEARRVMQDDGYEPQGTPVAIRSEAPAS